MEQHAAMEAQFNVMGLAAIHAAQIKISHAVPVVAQYNAMEFVVSKLQAIMDKHVEIAARLIAAVIASTKGHVRLDKHNALARNINPALALAVG